MVSDSPAFLANAPTHDLNLKAVILHIHTGGKHKHFFGHHRVVNLAAVEQFGVLHLFAPLLPSFTQFGIYPNLHALRVSLVKLFFRHYEFLHDLFPSAKGGGKRVQVEPPRFCAGVFRHKAALLALLFPAVFVRHAPAAFAFVNDLFLQVVRVKDKVCPHKRLVMPALRARHIPFLAGGLVVLGFNAAVPLDNRGRYHNRFLIPKCCLALLGKAQRVALGSGAAGVAVYLVGQQHFNRAAGKAGGAVRAHYGDVPAGEILFQDRVPGVSAFHIHQPAQYRRVAYHRGQAVFAECLPHVQGRLHNQDGRGGIGHKIAKDVQQQFGLAQLRRAHDNYPPYVRITYGVHDLPLVRCLVGVPPPRLGAALRAQHTVAVSPLG